MEKFDEIYFSDHGLTSTSASHLADIAQEVVAADEAMLRNMTFVTATLDIVGSASLSGKTVNIGYDDTQLGEVRRLLGEIASMNAFCAWMREAIKAKDNEIKRINAMDADDWLKANGEDPVNLYCLKSATTRLYDTEAKIICIVSKKGAQCIECHHKDI